MTVQILNGLPHKQNPTWEFWVTKIHAGIQNIQNSDLDPPEDPLHVIIRVYPIPKT